MLITESLGLPAALAYTPPAAPTLASHLIKPSPKLQQRGGGWDSRFSPAQSQLPKDLTTVSRTSGDRPEDH